MLILAFESSCDETAVALYDSERGLIAHSVYSQITLHAEFGGVVPELASRDHIRKALPLIKQTLADAQLQLSDVEGIAYTRGPGLMGALLVGAMLAKSLAFALDLPCLGVHHLEGHLLAPMLENEQPEFPFLCLLVSGGHTLLVGVEGLGEYHILGQSLDDAVGEAFDKTAKLLGLPYPGGAHLANLAKHGDDKRFDLPRPMVNRPGLDFSFSGIKTAALNLIRSITALNDQDKSDIAASFQTAIVDTLVIKCQRALNATHYKTLVVAGGVGANSVLRSELKKLGDKWAVKVFYPRLEFCTDNAAMIAYAGCQRLMRGEKDKDWAVDVKVRWAIDAQ
ncbi:MAG: tRNA (adenosine(37)-N6)-threonylcarbamoyltransferase complex transferase subunit TsaD [Gammaproteobacteria bacterium RIFCSPHIGHO2_12_FULL_41_15]|nr:MAG: tRNA (adenosine(37)-N6)-threonylcarbamoyltransferase complex transferase subunit TsaD [Gammaproteobacteria bacterium RIFCSPHIGHO2_12_FULL_41_15]